MKRNYILYIALFLLICLAPSAGLLFGGMEDSMENRDTAGAPELMTETGINQQFLSDAGAWFEDHFAFRNEWVTGYALLMGKVFGVSSQESVIVGKNGWLYYKDSLNDFQGAQPMTSRQLFDAAHALAMVQRYAAQKGIQSVFTIAPNKNSLYAEHMPYYYQSFRSGESNLARFKEYLAAEQVNYVDLYGLLSGRNEVLYHAADSHWNNQGAAIAADALLSYLEKEHPDYAEQAYEVKKDFEGDLDRMLYPAAGHKENEIYYKTGPQFTYLEEVESNFAPKIHTQASAGGSLVMYRDSFGNALLPYLAEAFGQSYFSRGLPYHLQDLSECGADTLIIERAERFLPDMAGEAPVMQAPAAKWKNSDSAQAVDIIGLEITPQGDFTRIAGKIPPDELETDSRVCIRVNGKACYEAFPVCGEDGQEGFSMMLASDELAGEENEFELFLYK